MIGEILKWSLMASGVLVVIILIRQALMGKMPKNLIYALWGIVLIRLLFPVLPSSQMSIFNLFESSFIEKNTGSLQAQDSDQEQLVDQDIKVDKHNVSIEDTPYIDAVNDKEVQRGNASIPLRMTFNVVQVLGYIWFIGCVGVLGYFSYGYYKLRKTMSQAEEVIEEEILVCLESVRAKVSIKTKVRLVKGDYPMIFGCFKPTICIPVEAPIEEVEMMLYHELLHLKYWDNKVTYLQILAVAAHWFNPLVWWGMKMMKSDMEIACDERVMRLGINKKQYAQALLNAVLAPKKELCLVQGMGENQKHIKERIMQITLFKKHKQSISITSVVLLVGIVIFCLTNATTPKNKETSGVSSGNSVIGDKTIVKDSTLEDNIAVFGVDAEGMRTDAIFVINLSKDGIKAISIPRDTKVEWNDEQRALLKENGPKVSKLCEMNAYSQGQYIQELAVKEIEEILEVPINHYVVIDFAVVERLIDGIGGLELEIPQDMRYMDQSQNLNINIEKGKQILAGRDVLGVIRYRRGYENGDLGRISMQQYVMKTLAEKIVNQGDVSTITSLVLDFMNNVKTNINIEDIPHYIDVTMKVNKNKISFETIEGEANIEAGRSYFYPA